jgi:hypothetical protein
MLSRNEREYLEGAIELSPSYQAKLNHAIRRKTVRALEDLILVFEKMTPRQLHFYRDEYGKALKLFNRIQGNYGILMLSENMRFEEIAAALARARIKYNEKKLFLDDRYRDRMILRITEAEERSGLDFWKPLPVEYKRQMFKEWKREAKSSHA